MTFEPKSNISRYRKRYEGTSQVPDADLPRLLRIAADLASRDDQYIPVFERVEQEMKSRQAVADVRQRIARAAGTFTAEL